MRDTRLAHVVLFALGFSLAAVLGGCSHSSNSPTAGKGALPAGGKPAAASSARILVPAKSSYDVALKPATKVVDAATIARAYRGATADGKLTFDAASATELAGVKPGTVVIFAGVALLKVSQVESNGGVVSVSGAPAGLEDAIDHGHIAWSAPLDFSKMAFNPPPGFHRVTDDGGAMLAILNRLITPAQAALSLSDNTWKGKVKDFDVTIALTPSNGNLHIDVDANKSIAGGTIDVHGAAQLNGFTNEGSITLADGSTTEVTFNNQGLKGTVDFDWKVAFDADHGGNDDKLKESAVSNLPFSLDFPMLLGPIPFKLSFKTGFAFQPTFSSKVAVAQGSYHASFGGSMPMTDTAGTDPASPAAGAAPSGAPPSGAPPTPAPTATADGVDGTLSGSGSINSYGGTISLAAIGLSTTVAMPKITFTIGLPSALDSFLQSPDFGGPYATFLTQANFLATGTLTMVQCEKRDLKLLGIAGYTPGMLGKLKLKPLSKTLYDKTYTEIRPPNITLCQ